MSSRARATATGATATATGATATGATATPAHAQPPVAGWHCAEWACELVGTMVLILGGLSAVTLDFMSHSPVAALVPSESWRFLLTGVLFASTGALVTVSPLGRRSGAHLNPAVSLAFFTQGHLHRADLAGYAISQSAGALLGAALVRWWWGHAAVSVHDGLTAPGHGMSAWGAAGVEAGMTGCLVLVIFSLVSSSRTARWTPLAVLLAIAVLVWQMAPFTGTSLNPARSLGPAVVTGDFGDYWVYVAGPLGGALAASAIWAAVPRRTLTAKLFHDPKYRSIFRSIIPARREPSRRK